MTKRRIQYSELGKEKPKPEKRVSTPVELARALAAERTAPTVAPRPPAEGPAFDGGQKQILRSAQDDNGRPAQDDNGRPAQDDKEGQLLLFTVGDERFGVPLSEVEEAVDLPVIHFVPAMPEAMLGVISLRGLLVPVYSPAAALGQSLASRTAALIFRVGVRLVGVVVDDVEDAIVVTEDAMRDLPSGDHDDLIAAVVHHEGHLISVMRAAGLVAACREARVATPA